MEKYRIELLLKINNGARTLFDREEKIVELFKLNDEFQIQQAEDENNYHFTFKNETFLLNIAKESDNIFSIVLCATKAAPYSMPEWTLDALEEAVREIKVIISNNLNNCSYEVLWDDVGIHYSKLAFPQIVEIENIMRKLITKFMLVSVGMDFF